VTTISFSVIGKLRIFIDRGYTKISNKFLN